MKKLGVAVAAAVMSSAAIGSSPWIDDLGRQTTMQFPGDTPTILTANGHDSTAVVAAFKRICLESRLDRQLAGKAAQDLDWGFAYRSIMMPFKDPVDIGGWYTRDAVVNAGKALFFNKQTQCNLIAAPSDASQESMRNAMDATLGAPSNTGKAFKKNGKPNKYYSPEWTVSTSQVGTVTVFMLPISGSRDQFQIAALLNGPKK